MQEKKTPQPTKHIQMMRSEPREDDPNVNIVMQSGVATSEGKVERKQPESKSWFWNAGEKNARFYLHKEKETFMQAKNNFVSPGASTSQNPMLVASWKEKIEDATGTQESDAVVLK